MTTAFSGAYTQVTSLSAVYKKTNTQVMVGIKRVTEEYDWFDEFPDLMITPSGNEMRIPLDLTYQTGNAMVQDGGYEAVLSTAAPTNGTFTFVQMNQRYSFTVLAQAFDQRAAAGQIQKQILYCSIKAVEAIARKIGLQTYGATAGTVAVVAATGGAGATQTGIQLKNAFGSTLIPGTTTAQKTYISNLIRTGEHVALIRSAAIVEYGVVAASPSAGSGVGYIDITFNSSITPTANDLVVFGNTVTDATIAGTEVNLWPVGFIDALTSTSVHGVSNAAGQYPNWTPGYTNTTGGIRMNFALKEAMMNGVWNNAGVQMDRMILSQGIRRDVIAGERAALRYDSNEFDLEGDLGKFRYLTSQLAPPGLAIGWYSKAVTKKTLSDKPDMEGGPSIFSLDKVQDRTATAAAYNFIYAKIFTSRAALAYASGLTEQ